MSSRKADEIEPFSVVEGILRQSTLNEKTKSGCFPILEATAFFG